MTLSELIQELEYIQNSLEDIDSDPEMFLAEQPAWPFKYSIAGVHETENGIYIEEGSQLAYLDKEARDQIGW